jgi:hypothetical protein
MREAYTDTPTFTSFYSNVCMPNGTGGLNAEVVQALADDRRGGVFVATVPGYNDLSFSSTGAGVSHLRFQPGTAGGPEFLSIPYPTASEVSDDDMLIIKYCPRTKPGCPGNIMFIPNAKPTDGIFGHDVEGFLPTPDGNDLHVFTTVAVSRIRNYQEDDRCLLLPREPCPWGDEDCLQKQPCWGKFDYFDKVWLDDGSYRGPTNAPVSLHSFVPTLATAWALANDVTLSQVGSNAITGVPEIRYCYETKKDSLSRISRLGGARLFSTAYGLPVDAPSVWAARAGSSLSSYSGSCHAMTARSLDPTGGLPTNKIVSLSPSPNQGIWVGTDSNSLTHITLAAEGLPDNWITAISVLDDGSAWVGTNSGLVRFVP